MRTRAEMNHTLTAMLTVIPIRTLMTILTVTGMFMSRATSLIRSPVGTAATSTFHFWDLT